MATAPKCKLCGVRHWTGEPHVFGKAQTEEESLTPGTQLVLFDRARLAIEQARTVDEVKLVRDRAEMLQLYARQARESLTMQNGVAEIKLRAERKLGEMLKGGILVGSQGATLSELGISKRQSSHWQTEASVSEEDFERHVTETKAKGEELTSAGLYRLGRQPTRPPNGSSPAPAPKSSFNDLHPVDSYACHRCGIITGLDAAVDDETWALISGHPDGGGLLCLWCMDELAAEKGITNMPVRLYFGSGRAFFSVPVDEFSDLGWSDGVGE